MRFAKTFITLLTFTVVFSFVNKVVAFAENRGNILGDNVNIRLEASTDAPIVAKLNSGQAVSVLSKTGDFYKVNYLDLRNVYISSQFIGIVLADAVVNADGVNIRSNPSSGEQSAILGRLFRGDSITVNGLVNSWVEITYNGKNAYISREFLSGELLNFLPQKTYSEPVLTAAATQPTAQVPIAQVPQVPQAQVLPVIEQVPFQTVEQTIIAQPALSVVDSQYAVVQPASPNETIYALVISDTGLNLRAAPSLDSEILFTLPFTAAAEVFEINNGWVRVKYDDDEGYLSTEFVEIKRGQLPPPVQSTQSVGQQVVAYGKQFLGTPYLWAGTNLNKGVDCSGFVYSVYKHFGITLNRSSVDMARNGSIVNKSELTAGDLVLFSNTGANGRIEHVGIYIGDGQFIHSASSKKTGVIISSLYEDYYSRNYLTGRRVLN